MNKTQKVLMSAAIAGLFAVPAFAKGPSKTSPATGKVCMDADGKTIPCEENKATDDTKKAGNGCGANGCGEQHKSDDKAPAKK